MLTLPAFRCPVGMAPFELILTSCMIHGGPHALHFPGTHPDTQMAVKPHLFAAVPATVGLTRWSGILLT